MPSRATSPIHVPAYLPPALPGSAYGYHAITRIPAALRRVIESHAHVVADPEADTSGLDEDTVATIQEGRHAMKQVVGEALAYWHGMLDARCGTKDARAPAERGGIDEVQYLRGFIDGHLSEHAPKYDFRTPEIADNAPHDVPPIATAAENALRARASNHNADWSDRLSVHSAGTDIPMPDTPFLSMAALVGYDENAGSPSSFQLDAMDQVSYQHPHSRGRVSRDPDSSDSESDAVARKPDPLAPRNFAPPPAGVAPRPARHLYPTRGPFEARAIPDVPMPEGVDRDTIARDWDPAQRAALFDYDGEIAWMESEDKEHPADAHQLAEALVALAASIFPGESQPRPVIPFADGQGRRPHSIAVIGTVQQIDHLVSTGTWATTWVCAQFFPNRPRPLRFVCTFGGLRLKLHEHQKARKMIRAAIEGSVEIATFADERGLDLTLSLDTMEVQHLPHDDGTEAGDLWNVIMSPPSEDASDLTTWRLTVANLRPRDPLRGELTAHTHPFKCRTCGCLTHPRRLCPTATAPGWTGTIPRWGVRKTLWGRHDACPAKTKLRDALGGVIRVQNNKGRPCHKTALFKKRKILSARLYGAHGYRRRTRIA